MRRRRLVAYRCRGGSASAAGYRGVETASGELEDGLDLFPGHGELLNHLIDRHAVFEVLENDRDRRACSLEHPGTADLAGDALHGRTLGPIERRHGSTSFSFQLTGYRQTRHALSFGTLSTV